MLEDKDRSGATVAPEPLADGEYGDNADLRMADAEAEQRATDRDEPRRRPLPNPQLAPITGPSMRERALPFCIAVLLLGYGTYQSILYYAHQPVPNPDFTGFLQVGRELLSGEMPSSFKRAPVLGVLQVGLSHFVPGPHPELTAGWLLNAILHPFTLVLLWLTARQIIGRPAGWVALAAAINPWTLRNLPDPIAETTLYFFILATLYSIFAKSRWRYVLAAVATMVRYDAAALILVAFILDVAQSRNRRDQLRALLWSAAATVPLALWLLGTVANFNNEGSTHYLKELATNGALRTLAQYLVDIWSATVSGFFLPPAALPAGIGRALATCMTIPVFIGFCFGAIHAVTERHWKVLGLLIFLAAYIAVHTLHSFVLMRFCSTVHWIILIVAFYGLQRCGKILRAEGKLSDSLVSILQTIAAVAFASWALSLAPALPEIAEHSTQSISMPYVTLAVGALLIVAGWLFLRTKRSTRDLFVFALLCLVVTSSQYKLVLVMGNGRRDIEFKRLAEWYRDNAAPQEKLATTYAGILGLYVPERRTNFLPTATLTADDPDGFVRNCRTSSVTYIAWDSRLGTCPDNHYYRLWRLENLAALAEPSSAGPYEFVTQVEGEWNQHINVFRLRPTDAKP